MALTKMRIIHQDDDFGIAVAYGEPGDHKQLNVPAPVTRANASHITFMVKGRVRLTHRPVGSAVPEVDYVPGMHSDQLPDFDVAGFYRWTVIEAHMTMCGVRINADKTARTFEDFNYEFIDQTDMPPFILEKGKRLMFGEVDVTVGGETITGPGVIHALTADVPITPGSGRFLGMKLWV
jgi:hypothetical protein